MKVILLKDVKKQGKKDDILEVSDGYAQNYLFKNGLAVKYTNASKNILDNELKSREIKDNLLVKDCEDLKKKIEKLDLVFKVKVGSNGKVFGSISSKQIVEELSKKGINIDKKTIKINNPIDTLGVHIVDINLHKKVSAKLNIQVKEG